MHVSPSAAEKILEKGSAVSILQAYLFRFGNCNCSEHCSLAFHCQQYPRLLCSRCFTLWFLTFALVSKFLKFCSILLFTIVFNLWYSGSAFFWWISILYNSNTVLSVSDSRILNLYNPSKMSSDGICVIDNRIFIPHCIEFLNIVISKNNCKYIGIILDRIIGPNDPEVSVDQVSNLPPRRKRSSLWAFISSRLTFFLKRVFWMILFSAEAIFAFFQQANVAGLGIMLKWSSEICSLWWSAP